MNREKIVFRFMNSKEHAMVEFIAPTRKVGDLGIGYFEMYEEDRGRLISFQRAHDEGIIEQELYDLAKENTKRLYPSKVMSMENMLLEMGRPIEQEIPKEKQIYVISNQMRNQGAIHVLYPENLEKIAEIFDDDLYLIPSSVHEMLAISKKANPDVLGLQDMIHETNLSQVLPEERLSNQVFCYSRATQEFDQVHTGRYLELEMTPPAEAIGYEELEAEEFEEFEEDEGMTMGH